MRYGMVIDLKRCVGCYGCQITCKAENGTGLGVTWARLIRFEHGEYPNARLLSLPLQCMHCANPPCVLVCPTGASYKRPDGIVAIDSRKCMGCRYCELACPYGAWYFQEGVLGYFGKQKTAYDEAQSNGYRRGIVQKCEFCRERLARGLEPACVANCIPRARVFGDLDDPTSEPSRLIRERVGFQLNPGMGTEPSVYYLPP